MKDDVKKLVEEAEDRAKKATRGDWSTEDDSIVAGDRRICDLYGDTHGRNADFIVNAKQDVPALCAAIRELDAEVETLKKKLDRANRFDTADFVAML